MCNQELFTIFSSNSLKLFFNDNYISVGHKCIYFTLAIEQNIISLAIFFHENGTVEEIYEIRPVAWLLVVRHVFNLCPNGKDLQWTANWCRISLLLLQVLSGIVRYSKFVPQDFRAYALYIIQCRPRKKKWCSHIYKFSSQTAAVKWLGSVYLSFCSFSSQFC